MGLSFHEEDSMVEECCPESSLCISQQSESNSWNRKYQYCLPGGHGRGFFDELMYDSDPGDGSRDTVNV